MWANRCTRSFLSVIGSNPLIYYFLTKSKCNHHFEKLCIESWIYYLLPTLSENKFLNISSWNYEIIHRKLEFENELLLLPVFTARTELKLICNQKSWTVDNTTMDPTSYCYLHMHLQFKVPANSSSMFKGYKVQIPTSFSTNWL